VEHFAKVAVFFIDDGAVGLNYVNGGGYFLLKILIFTPLIKLRADIFGLKLLLIIAVC
jgi:hypothetical protein